MQKTFPFIHVKIVTVLNYVTVFKNCIKNCVPFSFYYGSSASDSEVAGGADQRKSLVIELFPFNSHSWAYVQQLSMNPRIRCVLYTLGGGVAPLCWVMIIVCLWVYICLYNMCGGNLVKYTLSTFWVISNN